MSQTEATAMVKAEQNGIPDVYRMSNPDDFFEGLTPMIPRYTLNKDTGEFVNTLDNTSQKELRMAILGYRKTRRLFGEEKNGDPEWLCSALDAKNPMMNRDEMTEDQINDLMGKNAGLNCKSCPLKDWGKDGEKPICTESAVILGLDLSNGSPFIIYFKRTQLVNVHRYLNSFKFAKELPYARETVVISEMKTKGKSQKWYIPVFTKAKDYLPEDVVAEFTAIRNQQIGQFKRQVKEIPAEKNGDE